MEMLKEMVFTKSSQGIFSSGSNLSFHKVGTIKEEILLKGKHTEFVSRGGWEFIRRKNSRPVVSCLAITTFDHKPYILAVKQFRKPLGKYVIELPAGIIDEGETPEQAAERELLEETGWGSHNIFIQGPFCKSPGITDEITYLAFIECGLPLPKGQDLQGGEEIEVLYYPLVKRNHFALPKLKEEDTIYSSSFNLGYQLALFHNSK
jgi:ADP-ribose pyrophosphatase